MEQHIRFCRTDDGVRLARAPTGDGPPPVKPLNNLTHLEYDGNSPMSGHWLCQPASRWRLVRDDERGCGMSGREVDDFSLDTWVADLKVVVDDRCAEFKGGHRYPRPGQRRRRRDNGTATFATGYRPDHTWLEVPV